MTNKPNTVLVAKTVNATPVTDGISAAGELVVLDGTTGLPVDAATVDSCSKLQLGVVIAQAITTGSNSVKRPAYIAKTKAFKRNELKSILSRAHVAASEDTYTLTIPALPSDLVTGDNMHVRLQFKHAGNNFAKADEYAFALKSYASNTALATAVAKRINADVESWAVATVSSNVVTITAKVAIDNQANAKTMNPTMKYNQVEFELASYIVNGTNDPIAYGTVAHTVNSFAGIGNPYIIRDQEKDAFGYAGAMSTNVYPNIQPTPTVDLTATYDTLTLEMFIDYMAPDESYTKSTGMVANVYVDDSADVAPVVTAIKAWAGL